MSFKRAKSCEQAIHRFLAQQGYPHFTGDSIRRASNGEVLIKIDLRQFLAAQYAADKHHPRANRVRHNSSWKRCQRLDLLRLATRTITSAWRRLSAQSGATRASQKDLYIQLIRLQRLPEQRCRWKVK